MDGNKHKSTAEEREAFEANDVLKKKIGWQSKLHNATLAIWDNSNKQFIGRTWDSWAKISLFYLVFYSALAAFSAILLMGFFQTLDLKEPTQQNLYSLIKANPGMGFRPMPDKETTLIRFKQGKLSDYSIHKNNLDDYLSTYYNQTGENVVNCTEDTNGTELANKGLVCRAGKSMFGDDCTSEKHYMYDEGTPCVLLKINKVFGWNPKSFNQSIDNPEDKLYQEAKAKLGDKMDPRFIGVSCEGENDADIDNIGEMRYFPEKGYPLSFYPYRNLPNYRAPIFFVRFLKPAPGTLIQVWCKIWVSNIKHHKNDKAASIHFELLVD